MSTAIAVSVEEAVKLVDRAVESIKNDADQCFPAAASIGDAVRQGDIYIQLIDDFDTVPFGYKKATDVKYPFQLAEGDTQGSRHKLEKSPNAEIFVSDVASDNFADLVRAEAERLVASKILADNPVLSDKSTNIANDTERLVGTMYETLMNALEFNGPILKIKCTSTVSHPEHGNWILPAGAYRITYQRTMDSNSLAFRRVLD
jgi:hypothetical protein